MTRDLEQLIEAIIADGVITDKERMVLHHRAEREGISADEIDVLVEGKLIQRQNRSGGAPQQSAPSGQGAFMPPPPPMQKQQTNYGGGRRVENFGILQKCPNCGAALQQAVMVCGECGYEFRGVGVNSSVEKLSNMISNAVAMQEDDDTIKKIILNFPIPSTKEDLLEFIFFTKSKSRVSLSESETTLPDAYRQKYYECVDKAKFYYSDDPQFSRIFSEHEAFKRQIWNRLPQGAKIMIILFAAWCFLMLIAWLLGGFDT